MALNLDVFKTDLGDLYDATITGGDDPATAKTNFVDGLATLIDGYIRSAQIRYDNGLIAGPNAVTGGFVGGLQ